MKYSDAILEGFKKVRGRQCRFSYFKGDPITPDRVCVLGAANLAMNGSAGSVNYSLRDRFQAEFESAWGDDPADLNDKGMPWEWIYGMAQAAGL